MEKNLAMKYELEYEEELIKKDFLEKIDEYKYFINYDDIIGEIKKVDNIKFDYIVNIIFINNNRKPVTLNTLKYTAYELEEELLSAKFVFKSLAELKDYLYNKKVISFLKNNFLTYIGDEGFFYQCNIFKSDVVHEAIKYENGKFHKGIVSQSVAGLEFWYEIDFETAKSLIELKRGKELVNEWGVKSE